MKEGDDSEDLQLEISWKASEKDTEKLVSELLNKSKSGTNDLRSKIEHELDRLVKAVPLQKERMREIFSYLDNIRASQPWDMDSMINRDKAIEKLRRKHIGLHNEYLSILVRIKQLTWLLSEPDKNAN